MARPRATMKQAKEPDYSNVGVTGRKTGIMLKDSGVRDEHGLGPIDGIFSSPDAAELGEKTNGHSTLTDAAMDIAHTSTFTEPAELVSARRSVLVPPCSRSPIKTSLGSSPRRSLRRPSTRTSDRLVQPATSSSPHMTNGGSHSRADTYIQQPPDDANASPSNAAMVRKRGRKPSAAERGQKRAFELSEEQDEDTRHQDHTSDVSIPAPSSLTGPHDEDVMQIQTEDARVRAQELATVRRALEEQDSRLDDELRLPAKGKRGRPRKQPQNEWQNGTEDGLFPDLNSQSRASIQSQNKQVDVFREPGADIVDGPPKKERRGEAASVKGSSSRKPKPAERNPRAKVTSKRGRETRAGAVASMQKTPDAEAQGGVECDLEVAEPVQEATTSLSQPAQDLPKARGRPKPRSLVLLRSETPQDAANFTRSGRTSVKPLAFWRNEKFVFSNTKEDGQRLSLAGIKEVIRTREAEEGLPRHKRKKNTKKRASDVTSGDPGRPEKWEKAGSLEGQVMVWDPHLGKASDESLENIELAVAPKGFEELFKEVKNQNFKYAKTIALPFFHSGMVELPPGGEKRIKNSRQNHMVFWVFSGRVQVTINASQFSIGRGGMWQVPRGNFYGLQNPYGCPARIFFAQGSYMNRAEVEANDDNGSDQAAELADGSEAA